MGCVCTGACATTGGCDVADAPETADPTDDDLRPLAQRSPHALHSDFVPVGPARHLIESVSFNKVRRTYSGESVRPQLAQLRARLALDDLDDPASDDVPFLRDSIWSASKSAFLLRWRDTSSSFSSRSFLLMFWTAGGQYSAGREGDERWWSSYCQLVQRVVSSSSKTLSDTLEGWLSVLNVLIMCAPSEMPELTSDRPPFDRELPRYAGALRRKLTVALRCSDVISFVWALHRGQQRRVDVEKRT